VPLKTNYSTLDLFGYALVWKLWSRTLDSLTPPELKYEGTGDQDATEFASRWAPGMPTDVIEFKNPDGKPMIVFSIRFKFIPADALIPKSVRDCIFDSPSPSLSRKR